ncbi:Ribonuclease T [hydrothermal vent metagenome]|uniref:Ribonuclease T n=1 Tax=hydrothermal vent metagenome TaxID=652676 RepID=A0A1W1E0X0_9ZZZZ
MIDIETAGFNCKTDAMLEICAITIGINEAGVFYPKDTKHFHITPFKGANLESSALKFNGIDVDNPLRMAVTEKEALGKIFQAATLSAYPLCIMVKRYWQKPFVWQILSGKMPMHIRHFMIRKRQPNYFVRYLTPNNTVKQV